MRRWPPAPCGPADPSRAAKVTCCGPGSRYWSALPPTEWPDKSQENGRIDGDPSRAPSPRSPATIWRTGAQQFPNNSAAPFEVVYCVGGAISPLLANVYLHYVLDLWTKQWRKKRVRGDVIIVRYCDDFVVGFQHRREAQQYLVELRSRFERFGLELHADKTRLVEFGRFATTTRAKRGASKPETFTFLGLTHFCARSLQGWFTVGRKTMRQRRQAKLREVRAELRRRMHEPVPDQGRYVRAVVQGHANYYGVPGNSRAITAFRGEVIRIWRRTLSRRSPKGRIDWRRMARLVKRWVPPVRLRYLHPDGHLRVMTQGRSPVR
ncbi:MAG: reverse transcriptase domain-containing protein [Myxococcales bacterium]|nr:reverse transcriptase domain-containing protein [Myxococcales bacterium]